MAAELPHSTARAKRGLCGPGLLGVLKWSKFVVATRLGDALIDLKLKKNMEKRFVIEEDI